MLEREILVANQMISKVPPFDFLFYCLLLQRRKNSKTIRREHRKSIMRKNFDNHSSLNNPLT